MFSNHLANAWNIGEGVQPVTALNPDLHVDDAYKIQLYTIQQQVQSGQTITGKKIGLTSKSMQTMLGVGEPDFGHLLDGMELKNGDSLSFKKLLQPKVEAEIAFILTEVDLKQIGMALYHNDVLQNTGVGAAALGNPAKCVAWLANKLADYDVALKAGEVVLSGALSAAIEVKPGDRCRAKFAELGEVAVSFTE
ncbi:2-keto-4-pentenoate hydratase [Ureibacillus sp. FSL E2-3493]|uniref:2-keto-4-pentenoate hydratase n=1 Tax=Ureibacillus sp. FSL E2-3493 TaxID=2921367 RepID=UPI003119FC4B